MAKKIVLFMSFVWFLGLLLLVPHDGFSDALPESTQKILKMLKLDPSILSDIDEEHQVPKEWIEKARQEGKLRIISTEKPNELNVTMAPFKERYPFIKIKYSTSTRKDRIRTLVAYKSGRIVTDFQSAMGSILYNFKEANALEDLSDIPGLRNVPKIAKDPEGLWIGTELGYRCIGYNTKRVKKEDVPKKWEDLLMNPKWRGGNLALGNRPQLWALSLWKGKGENWTRDFLTKLFLEVKPQLRKEGMNSLGQLLAAGEFDAFIPAGEDATYELRMAGAPVGFSCPEPVPGTIREVVIIRGAPNVHSAKIYLNWFLSKEGQIAQFAGKRGAPVHKDLKDRIEFIANADEIVGKKVVYRRTEDLVTILPKLQKVWNDLWLRGGVGR